MNRSANNFDFLRVLAASLVLVSHQFALGGSREPEIMGLGLGKLGVLIFFSISGYLVSQSWLQDPHVLRFAAKRLLRIWPGLAVAIVLSAFLLGPVVSPLSLRDYLSRSEVWEYLRSLFLQDMRHTLPGVFERNPLTRSVNGSLWTIPLELRCYLLLLVAGAIGVLKCPGVMLAVTVSAGVYHAWTLTDPPDHFVQFALFFFAGTCLNLFRHEWENRPYSLLAGGALLSVAFHLVGLPHLGVATGLPIIVLYVATRSTPVLNRFGRFGDLSYGTYIYAFPVQQTFYWSLGRDFPFWQGMLITAGCTFVLAFCSWHLVERPALRLKRLLGNAQSLNEARTTAG